MLLDTLSPQLKSVPYGVCAVSLDQRILFWNCTAEHILGISSREVRGQRCDDVTTGTGLRGLTPECVVGCSSIRYVRAGLIPHPTRVRMLCSSGSYKWVSATPMVIAGILDGAPMLVHLFDDAEEVEVDHRVKDPVRHATGVGRVQMLSQQPQAHPTTDDASDLSRRELEVLRLVALGLEAKRIAIYLGIGCHTVRNNLRNLRDQLGASTKLDAVVKGLRLGIISVGGSPQ